MSFMLCRNKVRDYDAWKMVFDEEESRGATSTNGLALQRVWRSQDDPDEVFFLFKITDADKARAFVVAPESANAGRRAGVLEGTVHYVDEV